MEDLDSVFIYQQEIERNLRQKLKDTTLELETMKSVKTELLNLLKTAYQERDEARNQLQKLMNKVAVVPSSPINLQDMFLPKSITESSSLSHGSPTVDSFFDTSLSSNEFSNINNTTLVDNNNMGYLNCSPMLSDPGTAVIDCIAKERGTLPQKGKLVQAVIDAGPLLQNILLAGPLPTWTNPPPFKNIKAPPLTIKEYGNSNNTLIEPKSSSSLHIQASNAQSTCSPSMLNFAPNSWNNSWQFSSSCSSSVRIQVPSGKRQRHQ